MHLSEFDLKNPIVLNGGDEMGRRGQSMWKAGQSERKMIRRIQITVMSQPDDGRKK